VVGNRYFDILHAAAGLRLESILMRLLTAMLFTFVAFGLTGSGCASGEANISTGKAPQQDASALMGSCNPGFCQAAAGAIGCCVTANGPCGLNFGNGCVARGADGG
jgi:hypothetical protein